MYSFRAAASSHFLFLFFVLLLHGFIHDICVLSETRESVVSRLIVSPCLAAEKIYLRNEKAEHTMNVSQVNDIQTAVFNLLACLQASSIHPLREKVSLKCQLFQEGHTLFAFLTIFLRLSVARFRLVVGRAVCMECTYCHG